MRPGVAREAALCLWFVLVGLAFWGPALDVPVPDLTAAYGLFLVAAVAALAVRLLRGGAGADGGGADEPTPHSASALGPRRGRSGGRARPRK